MILLNPGPANTSATVKQALICEDICPRERSFGDLMVRIRDGLTRVVHSGNDYTTVLVAGSGTAGVESCICSVIPQGGRLLVVSNGAYGERIVDIAKAYQLPYDVEDFGTGNYPDLRRVADRMGRTRYTHLAVIHHETSTGMLNPVEELGRLCREHATDMIVDAMSSYAGLPIDIEQMGATYLVSSANKCIQGMAGLSFVVCQTARLEQTRHIPMRSLYLNLFAQYQYLKSQHQMRFTPPVQVSYALSQALDEYFAEGSMGRHARYMACFEALDGGMRQLGFRRLLPEHMLSKILTAYIEPDHQNYSFDRMHDMLFERGYTIYPGKGASRSTFRLANMGAIVPENMRGFVSAMSEVIHELGIKPLYAD